jgi:hypothetical protein
MMDNLALGHVFLRVIGFSLVSNIQTMRRIDIYLHAAFMGGTNGRNRETPSPKNNFFRKSGSIG